jgi:hypothetical protein
MWWLGELNFVVDLQITRSRSKNFFAISRQKYYLRNFLFDIYFPISLFLNGNGTADDFSKETS